MLGHPVVPPRLDVRVADVVAWAASVVEVTADAHAQDKQEDPDEHHERHGTRVERGSQQEPPQRVSGTRWRRHACPRPAALDTSLLLACLGGPELAKALALDLKPLLVRRPLTAQFPCGQFVVRRHSPLIGSARFFPRHDVCRWPDLVDQAYCAVARRPERQRLPMPGDRLPVRPTDAVSVRDEDAYSAPVGPHRREFVRARRLRQSTGEANEDDACAIGRPSGRRAANPAGLQPPITGSIQVHDANSAPIEDQSPSVRGPVDPLRLRPRTCWDPRDDVTSGPV